MVSLIMTKNPEAFEVVYLEPEQLRFRYVDETLTLTTDDGTFYPHITLRRAFPLSGEDELIVVRHPEEDEDSEIGVVRDLSQLDAESQRAVTRELRLYYLVPVIQRVLSIHEEFGFLYWKVQTGRGEKEFITRVNVIHFARQVAPRRWLLIDVNQARYEIRDHEALDAASRRLLERYLLL
jgi:hypothetical protein